MVRIPSTLASSFAIAALLAAASAVSFAQPAGLRGGPSGNGWSVTATGASSRTTPTGPNPGLQPVYWPVLVTHTGSSLATSCVEVRTLDPGAGSYPTVLQAAEAAWARLAAVPRCDASGPSPSAIVTLWTRTLAATLTPPSAAVWPPKGIVGLPLEVTVAGATTRTFTTPTPAGPLVIRASGALAAQLGSASITLASGDATLTPDDVGTVRLLPIETWDAVATLGTTELALPSVTIVGPAKLVSIAELHAELRSLA